MSYIAKNYGHLLGIRGFSDKLLKAHLKLYESYVDHINGILDYLEIAEKGTQEYEEVKRRFSWEFNGMRLHEAYFGNMARYPGKLDPDSDLARQIAVSFGSMESWRRDFMEVSSMRGIGWAVLAWDPEGQNLFNIWINEHDVGHLFYSVSLLVNDVFEHAYLSDYGADRKNYVKAFLEVVDWPEVEKRFASILQLSNARAS